MLSHEIKEVHLCYCLAFSSELERMLCLDFLVQDFATKLLIEANESLEDAGNELILTDDEVIRFQIGEVFAHMPKEEVEERIEQMKETTSKNLEKLEEEKDSVLVQMAELKKILYGKFKDSINLEED
ncbi:hypothetical protein Sjap_006395 [Stephania japonica]|uniref:Prefoldin subunit 4 n=1 Tax=Stephania japonica TaxID=461633 RepID=A0AAP0K871_9MAGN